MSDQAPSPRTSQTIQGENANLQFRAGGLQYVIAQNQKELAMINDRMRDLAIEYNGVVAKEKAEADLRREIEDKVKAEAAAKPKLEAVPDQNPVSEVNQATTQGGSETVPTSSPKSPTEQSQKQE